jgi:drug/metabolite transporter (DMT)-like permease
VSPRALVALLLLSATWGGSYLLIAVALRTTTPAAVTFGRFLPAAVLVGVLAWRSGALAGLRSRWRAAVLLAAVQQAAPMLLIAEGEQRISSGLAGTLVAVTPLWAALLAPALGGPRPRPVHWAGLLLGLGGVALLLGAAPGGLVGSGMVLLAAAGYAVGAAWTGRRFPDVARLGLLAAVLASSTLLLVPPLLLDPPTRLPDAQGLLAVLVLGLVGTGLAFVVMYWLIAEVGPERTMLVTYLAPVFAVGYGAALLGEDVGVTGVGGLVLVVAGAWLAARRPRAVRPAQAEPGAVPVPQVQTAAQG